MIRSHVITIKCRRIHCLEKFLKKYEDVWVALEKRNIVPSLVIWGNEKDEDEKSVLVEREYCIHPKISFFCYAGCKPT